MTKKRKHGTDEGSRKGGATTRAKFYPYEGKAEYMRVRVSRAAAAAVAAVPETARSRFFTEAIMSEVARRQSRTIPGKTAAEEQA